MNKLAIGLILGIGMFLYFAIVASLVSVKLNPENTANQQAYGDSFSIDIPDSLKQYMPRNDEELKDVRDMDDIMCLAVSEYGGTHEYEEYNKVGHKSLTDEKCDYIIQQELKDCDNFEGNPVLCSKDSRYYERLQEYLVREGLSQDKETDTDN